jgi:hypothetical protein
MNKIKNYIIVLICSIGLGFLVLHSTPNLAIRTHLFFTGHPANAFNTNILDDKFHNKVDKDSLKKENAKCYSLTNPPIEKKTQVKLRNYKVSKKAFLYFASYYGKA